MQRKFKLSNYLPLACLALLSLAPHVQAQLTAENLLANSVDEYGPKYQAVEDAITKFTTRDFDGARASLNAAKAANPELPPAGVMMSQLLFAAGQQAAAKTELERTVKDSPKEPEPWLFLGDLELQSSSLAAAQGLYVKAQGLLKDLQTGKKRKINLAIRTYAGLAAVAEGRGDWEQARKYIDQWLTVDPKHVAGRTRLARTMFRTNKAQDAYKVLQDIYSDDDTATRPEISMALLYEQDGKHPNAKKLMEKAQERDGGTLKTLLAVAKWALDTGELEIADSACKSALSLDQSALQAKMYEGMIARYRKEWERSENLFIQAHLQSPSNFGANNQLALVLIEQADPAKQRRAAEFATINAQLYSNLKNQYGREALVTLSWVNFRNGRGNEAQAGIQRAISAGGVSADSAYFAAKILHDRQQADTARKILEPIIKRTPFFINKPDAERLLQLING